MSTTLKMVLVAIIGIAVGAAGYGLVGGNQPVSLTSFGAASPLRLLNSYIDTGYGYYINGVPFVTSTGSTTAISFQTGQTGTHFTRVNGGICYIDPYAATIAASTTVSVDCQGTLAADASGSSALVGVTSGDSIEVTLSTTTAALGSAINSLGLHLAGASASTTAGHIELRISNLTGATFTWPAVLGTASGTASYRASAP